MGDCKTQERIQLEEALKGAKALKRQLEQFSTIREKLDCIVAVPLVRKLLGEFPDLRRVVKGGARRRYLFYLFLALDKTPALIAQIISLSDAPKRIASIVDRLEKTEMFYESLGGFLGYYCSLLHLLLAQKATECDNFSPPPVHDCQAMNPSLWKACYEGTRRLAEVSEIYAVGGAGDRLKLHHAMTGESMPAAALQFGGRPLLEWLFRDLTAREYWHYRVFGKQIRVPVLIMTSEEKNNDREVRWLLERCRWFRRGKKSLSIMSQALVPSVTTAGHFACNESFELVSRPGGHGIVWKLFQDSGVFDTLVAKGINYLLVRQVNNPVSSLDHVLMSFLGLGVDLKKTFGFVGCPRRPGFAEGMLVLRNKSSHDRCIANIEYTEFDALRKRLSGQLEDACPANTNILFASIRGVQKALCTDPIPGVMVNVKTESEVLEEGLCVRRKIARLESMMQAVSLNFHNDGRGLSTFIGLYEREKALSVTKRAFEQGRDPNETPEACLHDWFEACRRLFSEVCQFKMPLKQTLEDFILQGPNFIGFFHPALGPLWSVIGQKINTGKVSSGGELELEIAEISLTNLDLRGSLRILSLQPVGSFRNGGQLVMSRHVGRAYIKNLSVRNKGFQKSSLKDHLNRTMQRKESCTIILEGKSEIIIENVTIEGNFELTVPSGMQARLVSKEDGTVEVIMSPYRTPSFEYHITWDPEKEPKLDQIQGRSRRDTTLGGRGSPVTT